MSDYLENALANHVFRDSSYTKPTVLAIALCKSAPSSSDDGTSIDEVADSYAYARQSLNPSNSNWSDPTAGTQGQVTNSSEIAFPQASGGSWGTVTHIAICDSATHGAGNMLFYGELDTSETINDGTTFSFPISNLSIQFD
ncbi:phage tail fiber protein [Thalassoroseus pseudoceratinae]|uniref:phage tail fiber protein n=1 Tax=Thalassoroseus pseudoceratinae TaxID=2713176 RepID=UPI001422F72A|nr:hypothetical protein [Thalassoroseus pseudoceratinae]